MFHSGRRILIRDDDPADTAFVVFRFIVDQLPRTRRNAERESRHIAGFPAGGLERLPRKLQALLLILQNKLILALLNRAQAIARRLPVAVRVFADKVHLLHQREGFLQLFQRDGREDPSGKLRQVIAHIQDIQDRENGAVVPGAEKRIRIRIHDRLRIRIDLHHIIQGGFAGGAVLRLTEADHRLEIRGLRAVQADDPDEAPEHVLSDAAALHHVVEIAPRVRKPELDAEFRARERRFRRLTVCLVIRKELAEIRKLVNIREFAHTLYIHYFCSTEKSKNILFLPCNVVDFSVHSEYEIPNEGK